QILQQRDELAFVDARADLLWLQWRAAGVDALEDAVETRLVILRVNLIDDDRVKKGVVETPPVLVGQRLVGLTLEVLRNASQLELLGRATASEDAAVEVPQRRQSLLAIDHEEPLGTRVLREK